MSSAGDAPPVVKRGPSITKRSGRTSIIGKAGGEFLEILPVRGGAAAVEQPGERQHPGAGLDAADAARRGARRAQAGEERRGVACVGTR